MTDDLKRIEDKLDKLLEQEQLNGRNIYALYRRTTALAHMVEAASEGKEPRLPKTLRAEIDASLNPEWFSELAQKDSAEFIHRYGEGVLELLRARGIDVITKMNDFAPSKAKGSTH